MALFQEIYYTETDSTNNEIKRRIAQGSITPGMLIRTDFQQQGRGAYQNRWESERGQNLLFSVYTEPVFLKAHQQFCLSQAVSLALADVLKKILPPETVKLKWPNDVYVGDKKIAGILIETAIRGQHLAYALVGIGLNVNQEQFSNDIPNPTSLTLETGQHFRLTDILSQMEKMLQNRCSQLQLGGQQLRQQYLEMLYRQGTEHEYQAAEGIFSGIIKGVDDFGQLKIYRTDIGRTEVFGFKQVRFV